MEIKMFWLWDCGVTINKKSFTHKRSNLFECILFILYEWLMWPSKKYPEIKEHCGGGNNINTTDFINRILKRIHRARIK